MTTHKAGPRQPMVLLVCGETGVGKTYRNKAEIRHYMRDNDHTGKRGRKVLCFDTNDDDFPEYLTVSPDHIHALKHIRPRRIRPFNKNGSPMTIEQKKEVVYKILPSFRDGLIVLDDIDHFMTGAKAQSMIGALISCRHNNIDLLLGHQSISKISRTEWENCTWLRLHHQVDDPVYYKERIPNYQLVKIAQHIINEQYEKAIADYSRGDIDEKEFKRRKSFFVYVNMRELKVRGCSKGAFIRAAKKFIDQEEAKKVRMLLSDRDFKTDKPLYQSRNDAVVKLIKEYMRFHDERVQVTFQSQVA